MARHFSEDVERGRRDEGSLWLVWVLVAGLVGALLLRTFVIGAYYVPSGSMLDSIHEGDLILGERVTLALDDPNPGDVVTFDSPLAVGETLVKRVIAVGGQTVDLVDGRVYVDGAPLDEPYVRLDDDTGAPERSDSLSGLAGSAGITYPYTVPEGEVWVMGDNRTNSKDSRFFGPIPVDDVTSRVLFIYWPLSHVGTL
ncbi:signal peptidase I [Olsenella profusa]|uniref:Signal peptidase I n=1 Tax=Olsenella profusa TaxID=138595 RepID=A0ABS2F0P2_9ACTN|nr:signal peptidase I [Olsenella profusa]MBM6774109.1 signal peptidase I [Olsenella profusa]